MANIKVNVELLKQYDNLGFTFKFDQQTESLYLMTQFGEILSKEKILEVISGLMNFLETADDKDIKEYNQAPIRYQDYYEEIFEKTIRSRKQKKGHVFLYRELASNYFRFGETKDLETRKES